MKVSNILKLNLATLMVAGLFSLSSCSDKKGGIDYWDIEDDPADVYKPIKPRYIWVDAAANFPDFANSIENITRDLTLAKNAGFTDIIVDVRSTTGDILYNSPLCDQIKSMNAWIDGKKQTVYRTAEWDYLQAFIDEGHKLGLRIHAGFNTMTGGHSQGGPNNSSAGILFRDPDKREWANYRYNGGNPKNVMELGDSEKFFNPGNPEVQEYLCGLLKDLAKYNIDGIVLDRGRYNDLHSDFSPLSRQQFESYIGRKIQKWPTDILPSGSTNTTLSEFTDNAKLWLEYRAKTIYEFMEKAREAVKSVKPDLMFGVYVGGWYNSYYNTGVNWASQKYNAAAKHKWASTGFSKYGYAALMDQIIIGAYTNPQGVYGQSEWSMQGFCIQAKSKIGSDCEMVAGGPDVDWRWTGTGAKYTKDEILNAVKNSVDACINSCDGYFLFDIIHLKMDPEKWAYITEGNNDYIAEWNKKYGHLAPKD